MTDVFNPYHRWLGIPPEEQPADHYRLLGVRRFESDLSVIEHAADRHMDHLRRMSIGPNGKLAEKLLGEVSAASTCLLVPETKAKYDAQLKSKLAAASSGIASAPPPKKALPVARPIAAVSTPPAIEPPPPPPPPLAAPSVAPPAFAAAATEPTTPVSEFAALVDTPPAQKSPLLLIAAGASGFLLILLMGVVVVYSMSGDNQVVNNPTPPANGENLSGPPAPPPVVPVADPGVLPSESSTTPPGSTDPETSVPQPPEPESPSNDPSIPPEMSTPVPAPPAGTPPGVFPGETSNETETAPIPNVPEPNIPAPFPADPPSKSLLPVPSDDQLKSAEGQIREVYSVRLDEAKAPAAKMAVADEIAQQGRDTNNPPEVRLAALLLSRSLALEAGELQRALQYLQEASESFDVNIAADSAKLLVEASENGTAADRLEALEIAEKEFLRYIEADQYTAATELGRAALTIAKTAKNREATERITAGATKMKQREQLYKVVDAALQQLTSDPSNASAHETLGKWYWFQKGELEKGIFHLSKSGGIFAAVAQADSGRPSSSADQKKLADDWRTLASQMTAEMEPELLKRAKYWYDRCVGQLAGLEKARVEKYLTELNERLASVQPSPTAVAASPTDPTRPATPPVASGPGEWKVPNRNSNTAFQSFLGVYLYYSDKRKPYPVVNMLVPNANLWSREIQDTVRGRIPFDEISYIGTASIAIPEDATYSLEITRGGRFSINGKDVGGSGEVRIARGIHRVTFEIGSHGGPYIESGAVYLRHRDSGESVVFFNSWKEIQLFLSAPINGQRVMEVSNWQPNSADEVRVDTKAMKVEFANP